METCSEESTASRSAPPQTEVVDGAVDEVGAIIDGAATVGEWRWTRRLDFAVIAYLALAPFLLTR